MIFNGTSTEQKFLQDADVVLVCVGRREYRDGLGSEELGIEMEGKKIKARPVIFGWKIHDGTLRI